MKNCIMNFKYRRYSHLCLLFVFLVMEPIVSNTTDVAPIVASWRKALFVRAERGLDDLLECVSEDVADTGNFSGKGSSSPFNCLKKIFILDFRRLVKIATDVELDNEILDNVNHGLMNKVKAMESQVYLLQNGTIQLREELSALKSKFEEDNSKCEAQKVALRLEIEAAKECNPSQSIIDEGEERRKVIEDMRVKFPNKNWISDMFRAINEHNFTALQLSVELGADVNVYPQWSDPPLLKASRKAKLNPKFTLKAIKFLINKGANPTARDIMGVGNNFMSRLADRITPTDFDDIAGFLISRNLSHVFNAPGWMNETSFQNDVFCIEIKKETLSLLRENGVDFNAVRSDSGNSVLGYAVMGNRSLKMIADLVALGANPNHRNAKGKSLLHIAATFSRGDVVKYFIDLGLDVNALDKERHAPLWSAVYGLPPVVEKVRVLVDNGADVQMKYRAETILEELLTWKGSSVKEKQTLIKLLRDVSTAEAGEG